MKLELDELDLKPEHRECSVKIVTFDMFMKKVQHAIRAVGQAVFKSGSPITYQTVYAPIYGRQKA
ncbi:MAG TPA: hypothetical protein VJI33_04405 [Candidatus Paceibacterota bacterium]